MELTQTQLYDAIRNSLEQGNLAQAKNLISIGMGKLPSDEVLMHFELLLWIGLLDKRFETLLASARRITSMSTMTAGHLGREEMRHLLGMITDPKRLESYGWKCYSQNDEDGIIHEIFKRLGLKPDSGIFVEFGVEDGIESNTHLLLVEGFNGVWLEGTPRHVESIRKVFHREIASGALKVRESFITAENINLLLSECVDGKPVILLSIDIDGNDYWVWDSISVVSPMIVIVEYNGKFPPPLRLVQRYKPDHNWDGTDAYGCSLSALEELGKRKGYRLVGCNITGVNSFFVREDLAGDLFTDNNAAQSLYHPPRHYLTFDVFGNVGHNSSHGDFIDPLFQLLIDVDDKKLECEPPPVEIEQLKVLFNQYRYSEAEHLARKLTRCFPNHAFAWKVLGASLKSQGRTAESLESKKKAVELSPLDAEAHSNLGNTLNELGFVEDAEVCFQRALEIKPDFIFALSNLLYMYALTRKVSPFIELDLASKWEKAALKEDERVAARQWALSAALFGIKSQSGRKLRVGVVSAEIGQHAVADFLEPLLENFDRKRLHISLYPTTSRTEPRTGRIKDLADDFKPLYGISDAVAADLIRKDRIDILIDTTSHMQGCRLGIFAHRAAPVQCHYIGYHGSTGLTEMDYFIADEELLPPAIDGHFREKIWRLPRLWVAYRGDTSLPASSWQPSADGTIWLGSFNNLAKVRDETLQLWARSMNAIPNSKLLLKDKTADASLVQQRIINTLCTQGIDKERIEFVANIPDWNTHMDLYNRLDIALDTIPLNSGTTAFDALWMGVPVVAIEGDWMGSRITSTILKSLGKSEWVTNSEGKYVEKIADLAHDIEGRKKFRIIQRTLMANSPLCDAAGLARSLEEAFKAMFDEIA